MPPAMPCPLPASDAVCLAPPNGAAGSDMRAAIERDHTRFNPRGYTHAPGEITAVDVGGEPEFPCVHFRLVRSALVRVSSR
jgi:hypothetical protein